MWREHWCRGSDHDQSQCGSGDQLGPRGGRNHVAAGVRGMVGLTPGATGCKQGSGVMGRVFQWLL